MLTNEGEDIAGQGLLVLYFQTSCSLKHSFARRV
jgi:hypothetical protein